MRLLIIAFIYAIITSFNQVPDGKKLFNQQCAPCHHPLKALTGPPFQRVRNVYTEEQLLKFVHNPAKFIAGDKRMQVLKALYGNPTMSAYPYLKAAELKAILDYVDSFSYDSLSPVYAHRRFTAAQQDSVLKSPATGSIELSIEFEIVQPPQQKKAHP
jgi:cytochrome c551/c552